MKKHFLVACTLLLAMAIHAEQFTTFSFQKADGTVETLPAIGTKITFTNTVLNAANTGINASILLNNITFMCFGDPQNASSVEGTFASNIRLHAHNGTLQLLAPANQQVQVFNPTGQLLHQTITTGTQQTLASGLTSGLYLVQIGSQTLKTIIK